MTEPPPGSDPRPGDDGTEAPGASPVPGELHDGRERHGADLADTTSREIGDTDIGRVAHILAGQDTIDEQLVQGLNREDERWRETQAAALARAREGGTEDSKPKPKVYIWLGIIGVVVLAVSIGFALSQFLMDEGSGSSSVAGTCDEDGGAPGCPFADQEGDGAVVADDGEPTTGESPDCDEGNPDCGDDARDDGESAGADEPGTEGDAASNGGTDAEGGAPQATPGPTDDPIEPADTGPGRGDGPGPTTDPAVQGPPTPTFAGPDNECIVTSLAYLDGDEDSAAGKLKRVRLDLLDAGGAKAEGYTASFAIDKNGLASQVQATTGAEGRITLKVSQPVEGHYEVVVANIADPAGTQCTMTVDSTSAVEWDNTTTSPPTVAAEDYFTVHVNFVEGVAHAGYHEMKYEIVVADAYGAPLGDATVTWRYTASDGAVGTGSGTSSNAGLVPVTHTTTAYGINVLEVLTATVPGFEFDPEKSQLLINAEAAP